MGDDITRTVTVMLGFMFVFALIFGGLSLRDLNSSWNHSVETREKLAECVDSGWHFMVDGQELVSLDEQTIETASGNYSIVYDADSIHSKYSVIEYAEILNVLERMQMIGEEVLS